MSGLDRVVAALDAAGTRPRRSGQGYSARCPAHEDSSPSLSVSEGDRQAVVLTCFAGCEPAAVVGAIGLTLADLCTPSAPARPVEVARYRYRYEDGSHAYDIVRREPKDFRVQLPDGTWRMNGTRRVPYRLPEVVAETAAGGTVWIVEGEKDADAMARAGAVATCNPFGAGKWLDEFSPLLVGARVVVVADKDQRGAEHAADVVRSLARAGITATLVEAATGKDAADHLAAGHGLDEFRLVAGHELARRANGDPEPDEHGQVDDDEPLAPVDRIREALLTSSQVRAMTPPEPLIAGTIYRNTLAVMYGAAGIGKSFVSVGMALSTSTGIDWHGRTVATGPVLYIAGEGVAGIGRRIDAWEAHHGHPEARYTPFWLPWAVNLHDPAWAGALAEVVGDMAPALVVIDTYARSTAGADENSAKDTGIIVGHLDRIRRTAGACVLLVHHTGKDPTAGARGSSALRAAVDTELELSGDARHLVLKNPKQKDAAEAEPLHLTLAPVEGTDSAVATLSATRAGDDNGKWDGPVRCMEAVAAFFLEKDGLELTQTQAVDQLRTHWAARSMTTYRDRTVIEALERLTIERVLTRRRGPRNSWLYTLDPDSDHGGRHEPAA